MLNNVFQVVMKPCRLSLPKVNLSLDKINFQGLSKTHETAAVDPSEFTLEERTSN